MTRPPSPAAIVRLLSLALALGAPLAAHAADAAPPALQLAPANDPVIAKVNGSEIRKSDLIAAQHQLGQQAQSVPLETIFPRLIGRLINYRLLVLAGKDQKLADDPEVKRRMANLQDGVIEEVYVERAVANAATPEKLQALYNLAIKDKGPTEEVHARHILVDNEADAKAIIAQLAKGADFAKLAKEKNKAGAAGEGGDLGWFNKQQMVPEFTEAAFKLQKGEYTKVPVKTQFGYHIIKVDDRRQTPPPTFDEAKSELANKLQRDALDARIQELLSKAKIEQFALDGSPLPAAPPAAPAAPPAAK